LFSLIDVLGAPLKKIKAIPKKVVILKGKPAGNRLREQSHNEPSRMKCGFAGDA
jgi:hypothetical protein